MLENFSVKKPMTIFVAVILILLLGVISFMNMTPDLLPNIDFPYVIVVTTYPGASPEKVEASISKPLEAALSSAGGLKSIRSTSNENSSMVMLEFEQSTNLDSAIIEINSSIDLVSSKWEDTVSAPMIMRINPSMLPVMMLAIDVDGKSGKELSAIVNSEIIPAFERIGGVASVQATGLVDESYSIEFDDAKIQEINDILLAATDDGFAEAQTAFDEAASKLSDARAEYESQKKEQQGTLISAEKAIADGKLKLESAMNTILSGETELSAAKTGLATQKAAYELKAGFGLPSTDEDAAALAKINAALAELDKKSAEAAAGKKAIETQLADLNDKQSQLESGKLELASGLSSAEAKLSAGENELDAKRAELDAKRETAMSGANIDKLVSVSSLSSILKAQNFTMPAGYIDGDNGNTMLVKVGDKFTEPEQIQNLLLAVPGIDGLDEIRLSDVATVSKTDNSGDAYARVNGSHGVVLSFQRQSEAATAKVSNDIHAAIAALSERVEGLHASVLMDQGEYIDLIIDSVMQNLLFGALLAILVLLLFLRSWRPTLIIACSIPISVLFALALMYFTGITLNIISLSGLALGVGMLVDNSIVVIENIYRLRASGQSAAKAAVYGTKQVAGAIAASTLTTVCVFLPIVFTEGISRQLFTDMGLTVGYSLIASLIVALTLVPAMSANMLQKPDKTKHRIFDIFVSKYRRALAFFLRHKAALLIPVLAAFVLSAIYVMMIGTSFMPEMDTPQMSVTMTPPEDASSNDARATADELMTRLMTMDDLQTIGAIQNGSGPMSGGQSKNISFYLILNKDKAHTNQELSSEILRLADDLDCKLDISASSMDMSALGGSGVEIKLEGDDLDVLSELSGKTVALLESVEGTTDIVGMDKSSSELRVTVDKDKAMAYGLTVAQVYQQVAAATASDSAATVLDKAPYSYDVVIHNRDRDGMTAKNLADFMLTGNKNGAEEKLRLGDIANVATHAGPSSINRVNQTRALSVTAQAADGYNIGLLGRDISKKLGSLDVPEGYTVQLAGENETINSALRDLILMIALAIVFIYLIMVAQFQSLLSPFIVMFTLPLAFTGGLLALLITGFEVSVISMLGFLVLAGIIVNNGIVFVDYATKLREEGMERREALLTTGVHRIRPILMTALTTILGLLTMSFGLGSGAEMVQPLAIVIIGGLIYATLMTLFVIPVLYDMFMKRPVKIAEIDDKVTITTESL